MSSWKIGLETQAGNSGGREVSRTQKGWARAHLGGQSSTAKVLRQREGWRGWPIGKPVMFLITFLISQCLESDMKDGEKTSSRFESGPGLQGK